MVPNLLNGRVGAARLQENSDPGELATARSMHEVDDRVIWPAVNALFAGMVKVKLRRLVTGVSRNQKISAAGSVMVVNSDCFAIIH